MHTNSITYSHVASISFRSNFPNQWRRGSLGELRDLFRRELLLKSILALVEGLVKDNGRLLDALGLGQLSISCSAKQKAISQLVRDLAKGRIARLVIRGKVADHYDLVRRLELLKGRL